MANNDTRTADCDRTPYPFNFSALREGCFDPTLRKKVKWLIASDDDYIVYVDEDHYVEWTMNDNARLVNAEDLLTRVATLESVDTENLSEPQLETYKRLIGESVARLFEKDGEGAKAALDAAERWMSARAQEKARVDSLSGATIGLVLVAVPFALVALFLRYEWNALGELISGRFSIVTAAALGALGAWLSVLQRSGGTWLDLGAESRLYTLEGIVRILIGAVGGAFVGLLLRSDEVLPGAKANPALFAAVCLVAGLSERLVNTLAGALEGRVSSPRPAPAPASPPASPANTTAPQRPVQPPQSSPAQPARPTLNQSTAVFGTPVPPP